jgi:hypothetical protein
MAGIGGTGPFGEDTHGAWVNDQTVEEQLRALQVPGASDPGDWFDIHAGL